MQAFWSLRYSKWPKRRAGREKKKNERNTAKQVWSSMSIAWWENDRPSRFSDHPIRSALVHCQFKYNISMFWFLLHRVSQVIQVLFLRLPFVQSRSVSLGCFHRLFGHREKLEIVRINWEWVFNSVVAKATKTNANESKRQILRVARRETCQNRIKLPGIVFSSSRQSLSSCFGFWLDCIARAHMSASYAKLQTKQRSIWCNERIHSQLTTCRSKRTSEWLCVPRRVRTHTRGWLCWTASYRRMRHMYRTKTNSTLSISFAFILQHLNHSTIDDLRSGKIHSHTEHSDE